MFPVFYKCQDYIGLTHDRSNECEMGWISFKRKKNEKNNLGGVWHQSHEASDTCKIFWRSDELTWYVDWPYQQYYGSVLESRQHNPLILGEVFLLTLQISFAQQILLI